jgi:aminoglycoside phosphotransferase (APT) family kinase protein
MGWLADHQQPDTDRPCLIHNDYKFDNVVLNPADPLSIVGVLDWEMATIGDPLMDLGGSLGYWIEATDPDEFQMMRRLPTNLPGMPSRDELVALYAAKSGRSVHAIDFYYAFGLFRLAVICQQIYYRYYHGQTKDTRFAMLVFAVKLLEEQARRVIDRSDL